MKEKKSLEAGLNDVIKSVINFCNNGVQRREEGRNQVKENDSLLI